MEPNSTAGCATTMRHRLTERQDFYDFVMRDFDFYSRQYGRVVEASTGVIAPDSGLRFIRYNADHSFTLQNQLLLAPLAPDDDPATIDGSLSLLPVTWTSSWHGAFGIRVAPHTRRCSTPCSL